MLLAKEFADSHLGNPCLRRLLDLRRLFVLAEEDEQSAKLTLSANEPIHYARGSPKQVGPKAHAIA